MSTLVSNGCVDYRGRIADKRTTGGFKAAPFITASEVAERLSFFCIAVNLTVYLVTQFHQSLTQAATHVSDWVRAAHMLTILGAFLADAYLGRFRTLLLFSIIYSIGMLMLTLTDAVETLHPPLCTSPPQCAKPNEGQTAFLFVSLGLVALGTGGIKPCVSSFGGDQYDDADDKEVRKRNEFFNWFFFAINMGSVFGITVLVYVREVKGWSWGFGIPTAIMILSIVVLAVGSRYYRYQKPLGSPFTRFLQVFVASVRNHFRGVEVTLESDLFEVQTKESDIFGARKLIHSPQYSFLDKAAVRTDMEPSRWRLCTVTQVEEFKSFVRVLPIWATTIALSIAFAQLSTFFLNQAGIMNRSLIVFDFNLPVSSTGIFTAVSPIILVPFYEKLMVPVLRKLTGNPRGLTSLQRIGVGLFISILALVAAAIVEQKRLQQSPMPLSMSVFWLFPQFFLLGAAEVFTYVGQLEFFYDEATDGTRCISSAIFLSEIGIGHWLNSAIIMIVGVVTGGEEKGWLRNDINMSRFDYYYWVIAGISGVNFLVYLWVSWRYKGRTIPKDTVEDEGVFDITQEKGYVVFGR